MSNSVELNDMIIGVEQYVERAASLLASGQYADLAELEPRVGALCDSLHKMRVDQAQHYMEQLEQLYVKVDELRESMLAHQTEIKHDINGLAGQKRASHAYVKSGALGE